MEMIKTMETMETRVTMVTREMMKKEKKTMVDLIRRMLPKEDPMERMVVPMQSRVSKIIQDTGSLTTTIMTMMT